METVNIGVPAVENPVLPEVTATEVSEPAEQPEQPKETIAQSAEEPENRTVMVLMGSGKSAEPSALTEEDKERLEEILAEDFVLMKRLKEEAPELYHHAIKVGELSGMAAEMIDAEVELARAGGYYHEIGKLVSSNYIKEGIKLAKEHDIPKSVIDIIKQHNIKVGQPNTPEAALVMISDSILGSVEYMKSGKTRKLSPDKLINGIFDARLLGGNLDRSGITLAQYKILKRFYANAIATELDEIPTT